MSLSSFVLGMAAGVVLAISIFVIVAVIGGSFDKTMDDDFWPKL